MNSSIKVRDLIKLIADDQIAIFEHDPIDPKYPERIMWSLSDPVWTSVGKEYSSPSNEIPDRYLDRYCNISPVTYPGYDPDGFWIYHDKAPSDEMVIPVIAFYLFPKDYHED